MPNKNKNQHKIAQNLNEKGYCILHGNSVEKIKLLEDNSVKLMYGSPPYPNAKRNYKTWKIEKYIEEMDPFLISVLPKLKEDGFIVINVKSNRTNPKGNEVSSERSLIIEKLMIHMKEQLDLYCVDIEIWIKSNPVPTGVRVACQDAYEYNLWFSKSPKWEINLDPIRRDYTETSLRTYQNAVFKPRKNGLSYVSKEKKIQANELGALPLNIFTNDLMYAFFNMLPDETKNKFFNLLPNEVKNSILNQNTNIVYGAVSGKSENHQAVQPEYLPEKYILACTSKEDIVLDPWVGSGTTGVTSIKLDRKFIGIDISKEFCDLASQNIEKYIETTRVEIIEEENE